MIRYFEIMGVISCMSLVAIPFSGLTSDDKEQMIIPHAFVILSTAFGSQIEGIRWVQLIYLLPFIFI